MKLKSPNGFFNSIFQLLWIQRKMKGFPILYILVLVPGLCLSQISEYKGSFFSLGISYLELKDEFNHGLVFKGPDLNVEYGVLHENKKRIFSYSGKLASGGNTSRGTWSFRGYLSPLNIDFAWNLVAKENFLLFLGPSFQSEYNFQIYPELHAGPIHWLANYSLGPQISGFLRVKNHWVKVQVRNTALAVVSRPSATRDPYYFSKSFADNFSDMHRNLKLVSSVGLTQLELETSVYFHSSRKKSISYVLNHTNYSENPRFEEMIHSIKFTWWLKSSKS